MPIKLIRSASAIHSEEIFQKNSIKCFMKHGHRMEEGYYDDKFHGTDWKKTRDYYKQFLPHLNNRADLRIMLNDMLGELNSSHQGFGTFGD